ncbi:hypothetical protein SLE2022_228200 [Rubroshorea leprosula]
MLSNQTDNQSRECENRNQEKEDEKRHLLNAGRREVDFHGENSNIPCHFQYRTEIKDEEQQLQIGYDVLLSVRSMTPESRRESWRWVRLKTRVFFSICLYIYRQNAEFVSLPTILEGRLASIFATYIPFYYHECHRGLRLENVFFLG